MTIAIAIVGTPADALAIEEGLRSANAEVLSLNYRSRSFPELVDSYSNLIETATGMPASLRDKGPTIILIPGASLESLPALERVTAGDYFRVVSNEPIAHSRWVPLEGEGTFPERVLKWLVR